MYAIAFINSFIQAQFCQDNNFILSSKVLLPRDSYTYISEAWHTTSWLDHCITTADAHASLRCMSILYGAAMTDHIPFVKSINVDHLPVVFRNGNKVDRKTGLVNPQDRKSVV